MTLRLPPAALGTVASQRESEGGDAPSPAHRPVNIARTVFHVGAGALALTILRLVSSRAHMIAVAASFAIFCWTCEILRRRSASANERLMRFFRPVAHANEWHEVNSSTWYATALLIMSIVVPFPAAEVGVVVLAVADPMAGFVGRRFGKRRLVSGRSLEGGVAFAVTGALASFAWMTAASTYDTSRFFLAAVAGIVGAIVELAVSRVDDNLAIPLGTSLAVALSSLACA